ncbi:MAG: hypothetical protein ACOYM8_11095 [Caulobacterales bacterium]
MSKKPSHYAYVVVGEGEKKSWVRIGAAWPNADGHGLNLVLDATPVSGRLTLRVPSKQDGEHNGGAQ